MAKKDVEMQTTECPLCHENYNNPKILPCAHLLCRDCLVSWMKKKRDALCPLCSSAIVDPQNYSFKKCEDLVDSMPTDHVMSALIESVKILSQKHDCCQHRDSVATSLCLSCGVKLCQSCVDGQKNLPLESNHILENLSPLNRNVLSASRQESCSVHPDKNSESFCTVHNAVICPRCVSSNHRTCQKVISLQKMYEKFKGLSNLEVKLNTTVLALDQALENIETHMEKSEQSVEESIRKIDEACDSLLKSVEACRKRLKKLVVDEDNKVKATTLEMKNSLVKRRNKLIPHVSLIQRVQLMTHSSAFIAMIYELENRITNFDLDTSLLEKVGQNLQMVTLTIERKRQIRVEKELEEIGDIVVTLASDQDKKVRRINVQPRDPHLTSTCTLNSRGELLKESDGGASSKASLCNTNAHFSKESRDIVFSVKYDSLVKLMCAVQEHITDHTIVRMLEDKSQDLTTHEALTIEINSLEYEAMKHLLSRDSKQYFSKVKEDGEKVTISFDSQERMDEFKETYKSVRQEEVKLTEDEVFCLKNSRDFLSEDMGAFIKLLESKVVIMCFDYNAMTKAKHLISVKIGKLKVTQRNKRKFEGGIDESGEMDDCQTSLATVSHSKSGHSHVRHKDFTTKSGIKVSVYKADITQLTVDVIVNAANRDLKHDGGVAAAIARAAGPSLELEGDDYLKVNGQLQVTDVVPTTSGNLSCRKVLHAVGPRWVDYQDNEQCQYDLEKTIFSSLEKAHNMRFSSVALSSISSAIFGVPKEICAQMYLAAVQKFEQQLGSTTTIQHIHFVDINDEMVGIIQDTFTSLWNTPVLPPRIQPSVSDIRSTVLGSSSVSSHSSVEGEEQHRMNKSNFHIPEGSKTFVTESGINVFVYKGDITQLSVDGIVVDGRFPKASGVTVLDQIIKEEGLTSKSIVPLSVTNVIVTSARNLSCKNVLWATCPSYYDNLKKAQLQHDLRQTVLDCLAEADKHKFTSVGVSASLDVLKDVNTPLAYARAIQNFENGHGGATSLQQIHIVGISDSVVDIIQNTFSTVWTKLNVPPTIPQSVSESRSCEVKRRSLPLTPPTSGNNLGGVQHESGVPDIPLPANSKTFITLSGINVSIYKADITKLAVDIIVSAADKGLIGGAGVSRAIEIAAGPTLSEEKRKYIRDNGCLAVTNVVMTTAGKLPCRKVLHAVGPGKYVLEKSVFQDLLVQTIFNCLKKAQDLRDISIAFSSISAAMSNAPKEDCARMYLEAVKKFDKEYGGSSHVRYIHFVDIDDIMVGAIQNTFQRYWDIPVTQDDSHQSANDMKRLYIDQRSSLTAQPLCTDIQLSTDSYPLFLDLNKNRTKKRELCYLVDFRNLKLFIKQGDVNDVYSGAVVHWQTSLTTLLDQPVKNYVKQIGDIYPTEEIRRLKRGYTGNSTVETIKLSSDLTLIFSVNPPDMTSARVEEKIRGIFNTVSNSNIKLSIPFPLGIKAAGAKLEQFAVGVYTAVEIYAKNLDKSLTEVNIMDTDEKSIRMVAEIIAHKMAQDKSLTALQKQKASSHTAGAENILAADDKTNNDLRHFPCGHGFCTKGFADSFQQNPVCLLCSNKHQLNGTMRMRCSSSRLKGFDGVDSFVITYDIPSGHLMDKSCRLKTYSSVSQMAFLPNTEDGRKVLMLLKVAWDRGLTFTVIESETCPSVVLNGIEHKTLRGGGCSDGYPDHDYLNRVQQTLTSRGVTEKALSDIQKEFISHPEHFLKSYNYSTDFSFFFS